MGGVTVGAATRREWAAENVGEILPDVRYPVGCAYCGQTGGYVILFQRPAQPIGWLCSVDLEWDHIYPLELGGANVAENLTLACRRCNRSKGHKTLSEWLCAR